MLLDQATAKANSELLLGISQRVRKAALAGNEYVLTADEAAAISGAAGQLLDAVVDLDKAYAALRLYKHEADYDVKFSRDSFGRVTGYTVSPLLAFERGAAARSALAETMD